MSKKVQVVGKSAEKRLLAEVAGRGRLALCVLVSPARLV